MLNIFLYKVGDFDKNWVYLCRDTTSMKNEISWKPLRFASWFPTLISCSPNLPSVYIRLCKHGNHFTFLQLSIQKLWFRLYIAAYIYILLFTGSSNLGVSLSQLSE